MLRGKRFVRDALLEKFRQIESCRAKQPSANKAPRKHYENYLQGLAFTFKACLSDPDTSEKYCLLFPQQPVSPF